MNNFIVYNTHLKAWDIYAFGPEKQDGYTACHHHHQGQKIDHTKKPLLTHMPPHGASARTPPVSGWGRGSHRLPTPPWREQKGTSQRASAPRPGQIVSVC